MSILHGVLHLFTAFCTPRPAPPIDFLWRSLAEDARNIAIGVISSGMGSDGTMGLRASRKRRGLCWCRRLPRQFDSMSKSAIAAGLADLIAPAEDLPGKIIDYLKHNLVITKNRSPVR